jgi:hypothetical protein
MTEKYEFSESSGDKTLANYESLISLLIMGMGLNFSYSML